MHNAEKPNPPASVRDTGGQGELLASSNTRARNSLRAVATHNAPSPGVHGEESKPVAHPCRGPGGQAGDYQKRNGHPLSGTWETWMAPDVTADLDGDLVSREGPNVQALRCADAFPPGEISGRLAEPARAVPR